MASNLSELHLADLHARAAEAGIEGFRLLSRTELLERLDADGDSSGHPARRRAPAVDLERDTDELTVVSPADDAEDRPRRRRGRRGGRGRGGGRQRERLAEAGDDRERAGGRQPARERERADRPDREPDVTEPVSGVLELTRQRHGFLRLGGLTARDDDVYVSASQVRRCELRAGDEVAGPAREPGRGERHRALVHVDTVNGGEPQEEGRPDFDDLTPAPASRRISLGAGASLPSRAIDLLAPLAHGQRVLVRATPHSGRTTLLRELAQAIAAGGETRVIVLLVDERPEEVPAWREALGEAELALAPADLAPVEQVRIAELALERARRSAESGADAVLICDSLSRLAVAADGVAEVKRLFGSGRELSDEGAGSLTVIATAFDEGDDEGSAERAVTTTETSLVTLDASLAEEGIAPALRFADCRAEGEDRLRSEREMDDIRRLRAELAELTPPEAAALLRERLG